MQFFNKTKGAISIFLVIILVPMMTVSALFVDASRVRLAKGVAESAGDLTLNTALTAYDVMLKDVYGFFATAQDTKELFGKLEDYYRTCITSSGVSDEYAQGYVEQIMAQLGLVSEEDDTSDILNMQLVDFKVNKLNDATLANPAILKKQIVDFMKYRAPINTGLSFITSLQNFSSLSRQTELVEKRQDYYVEQGSVMESAQKAWESIHQYNQAPFAKDKSTFFSAMEKRFSHFPAEYDRVSSRIIKNVYHAEEHIKFRYLAYRFELKDVEIDGSTRKIPILYKDSNKTNPEKNYSEYEIFSKDNRATSDNIKTALIGYKNAYDEYRERRNNLMPFDENLTYALQYIVQTSRKKLYNDWVSSMVTLYEKYNALQHAATYPEKGALGKSEALFGEASAVKYNNYYIKFTRQFEELIKEDGEYDKDLDVYSGYQDRHSKELEKNGTALVRNVAHIVANYCNEVKRYRDPIEDAIVHLKTAVEHLNDVYKKVKPGGTLEKKREAWNGVATDKKLKNTSMAKQDMAEIGSLSTYLDHTEVDKLIKRLNNIIPHLEEMIIQIDSYTYFDSSLIFIPNYDTLVSLFELNLGGVEALENVPIIETELDDRILEWLKDRFKIGLPIDVSWEDDSGHQPCLTKDKLNFYSYLSTHFENIPEIKQEDASFYDEIKEKSSTASSDKAAGTDSGNITSTNANELFDQPDRPSEGKGVGTPSGNVDTSEKAVSNTKSSLSDMFKDLGPKVVEMGTDLRDKLYISDYIISMFSYDTIEKELDEKNDKAKTQGNNPIPKTLTLVPMNAEHNFAYGKEVEYIIYGGENASNLTKAYGSIFGIRLGFNLIYAFMDSEIRDTAFAIATPISAATLGVVPVPLIQAAIIIAMACCESAIDLNYLKDGESIPLFKTKDTWRSPTPSNFLSTIRKGAVKIAETAVDKGVGKLTEVLDMTNEELDQFIKGGTDDVTKYLEDSYNTLITRHANTAIQKLTTLANNAIEEKALKPSTDMEQYISKGLDDWLAAEGSGVNTSSDLSYIVKKEAVTIIKSKFISQIVEKLQSAREKITSEIDNMGSTIMEKINEIRRAIVNKVTRTSAEVIKYKDEMLNKVKASMKDGAQSLKNTLNKEIEGIFGSSAVPGSDNTGVSSLLTFSYSDYLRLFLMIGLFTNETNEKGILLRTADVIQVNMGRTPAYKDKTYRLSNSAVYVEMTATVQVKPILLAIPIFSEVAENPSADQKWYTFKYKAIRGY